MTDLKTTYANLPKYVPISQACDLLGFRRSKLYSLAGDGQIRIIKVGGRSLVDLEAALTWMAALPLATIAPSSRSGAR